MKMISRETGIIKENVVAAINAQLEELFKAEPCTEQEAEEVVWQFLLSIGWLLDSVLLARCCWQKTVAELADRGMTPDDVTFRLETDYWAVLETTFGTVLVPWFTYRHKRGAKATRTASRSVLPLHPRCHSSTLLLRWVALLGTHAVFATAEHLLKTLTHGTVSLEDTTIASHCDAVGRLVERQDMYKSPEEIREHLLKYATVDKKTGEPLLNVSTDAHNELCYVEDTWQAKYRNVHAIRMWYTDKRTGRGVTLGGEFLVGSYEVVMAAFEDLITEGILPANGDYGDGVVAQLVFVADGMPWFKDHIVPKFSDLVTVLDNRHLLKRILDTLKAICRKGSPKVRQLYGFGRFVVEGRCRSGSLLFGRVVVRVVVAARYATLDPARGASARTSRYHHQRAGSIRCSRRCSARSTKRDSSAAKACAAATSLRSAATNTVRSSSDSSWANSRIRSRTRNM